MSIIYPNVPQGPDLSGFTDGLDAFGRRLQERRYERQAGGLLEQLFLQNGGSQMPAGQQPMSLASLGQQGGQVQRSPLPPVQDAASQRTDEMGGNIFGRFMKTVQAGGVTNPAALAAIASTGKHESGFSDKNAYGTWDDPSQSGQAGMSGGIMSWRGPRLQALQQFAQANGDNPNAPKPETQAQFLLQEDPSLIQKLQQVRSPQEAQQLMNNAWRFAGYDQQGGEAGARMQTAQAFAGQFGGQVPAQEALESLGVGQSMPMGGGQIAQPQGGSLSTGGFNVDPALMKQLFSNPITRPLAIDVARTRLAAMQDQNDPMKKLAYEKAVLEVDNLRNPKPKAHSERARVYERRSNRPYLKQKARRDGRAVC